MVHFDCLDVEEASFASKIDLRSGLTACGGKSGIHPDVPIQRIGVPQKLSDLPAHMTKLHFRSHLLQADRTAQVALVRCQPMYAAELLFAFHEVLATQFGTWQNFEVHGAKQEGLVAAAFWQMCQLQAPRLSVFLPVCKPEIRGFLELLLWRTYHARMGHRTSLGRSFNRRRVPAKLETDYGYGSSFAHRSLMWIHFQSAPQTAWKLQSKASGNNYMAIWIVWSLDTVKPTLQP